MKLIKVDPKHPENMAIEQAAKAIRHGRVIAAPTDTVYGLFADPFNDMAVKRIYEIKGRDYKMPLILLVADVKLIDEYALDIPSSAERVMQKFWPGALTVILKASPRTPGSVLSGGTTIGFRQPAHPVMLALIEAAGGLLASTSANRSGGISSVNVENIIKTLSDDIEGILDAGAVPIGRESSIVDFTTTPPRLLREGHIIRASLERIIGKLG